MSNRAIAGSELALPLFRMMFEVTTGLPAKYKTMPLPIPPWVELAMTVLLFSMVFPVMTGYALV